MNKDVKVYIDTRPSPQKEICKKVRSVLLRTFPDIEEGMKWGVPAYGGGMYYIVALKDHVNLGFSTKGLTKKEKELFDGGGTTTRTHLILNGLFSCSVSERVAVAETIPYYSYGMVERQDAAGYGVRELPSLHTKCKTVISGGLM